MLRAWCKLLLILAIGLYGFQAASAGHHIHALEERGACAACVVHDTPAVRPPAVVAPTVLPEPPAPLAAAWRAPAPPSPLDPSDVSPSTSPPAARRAA